jgi:hypothetical protein
MQNEFDVSGMRMEEFDGMIMDETRWIILEEIRRKFLNSRW